MAIPSRQIGWGTEDNLLWQISKQLERLTCVTAGGCGSITTTTTSSTTAAPVYKVFTALLTQSGEEGQTDISSGTLIVGVSYIIDVYSAGDDFTNVGAPNNNDGTWFIATGTTPASWTAGTNLVYNTGAPVATVLENTIGNVWFTYNDVGDYTLNALAGLLPIEKTFVQNGLSFPDGPADIIWNVGANPYQGVIYIATGNPDIGYENGKLFNYAIEIRVYN